MIIESAYESIEVRNDNTVGDCFWRYFSFISKGHAYRIVFEYNKAYGLELVRQWSIDLHTKTNVPDKFFRGEFVSFDCSSGLCGIREFENNCIAWEFLFKPLGLSKESIFERQYNWSMSPYGLKQLMTDQGIEFEIIKDCNY